jgi:hypothetical protein
MSDGRVAHECSVPGCDAYIPRRNLMCRGHWLRVRRWLRQELWRTYQSYQAGRGSIEDYVRARDAAIADAERAGAQEALI